MGPAPNSGNGRRKDQGNAMRLQKDGNREWVTAVLETFFPGKAATPAKGEERQETRATDLMEGNA